MNPALPAGANGISLSERSDDWSLGAQLVAGWIPFPKRAGLGAADDPTQSRLDVGLVTLLASFGRGTGVGIDLQLPAGAIGRSDLVNGSHLDVGLGDLEVRGRSAFRFGRVSVRVLGGLALPTGPYAARSGAVALLENARYLTLGRGTVWGLADLETRLSLSARLSPFVNVAGRLPFGDARDGFRWGPEFRATAGVSAGPFTDRFSLSLALETLWRAQSTEIDPFSEERVPSVNTGGLWLTVLPSAQVRVVDSLVIFVAARIPAFQKTEGLQFIPDVGAFAGVAGSWDVIRTGPVPATPTVGRITVVDYWATWCEPCKRLEPVLTSLESPLVEVKRVDVSQLSAEELDKLVPGASGLPVVEVFGTDGTRLRRLVGEEVFEVPSVVQEALK